MGVLDLFRLDGKRVFISGGSRGLGREMALALAEAGADIVLNGRDPASLATTAGDIEARGRKAWTFSADMSDPLAAQDACDRTLRDIGPNGLRAARHLDARRAGPRTDARDRRA